MVPVIPLGQMDNYSLLNVSGDISNEGLIVGCFLLGFIFTYILFMERDSRFNGIHFINNAEYGPYSSNYNLTSKLLSQLLHNINNSEQTLNYMSFPSDHPGHLNLQSRTRLVSIIRSSGLADQYRFGSSSGTMYIKNSYRYPDVTSEMIGVVLSAESGSN